MEPPAGRDPWPWVGGVAALAFLALAVGVVRRGAFAIDDTLTTAVRSIPVPVGVWEAMTFLGGAILIPVAVVFVLVALMNGRLRLALILAVVLIGATLFTDVVKDSIARPRPTLDPLLARQTYSFPSGHSLNSAAIYGLIALVVWRGPFPLWIRRAAVILGVSLPLLIGVSRIALGAHYPTDVLGGWLAGLAFVALGAMLIRRTGAMERDRPRRVEAGAAG